VLYADLVLPEQVLDAPRQLGYRLVLVGEHPFQIQGHIAHCKRGPVDMNEPLAAWLTVNATLGKVMLC
jgi:hypothetical protein